MFFSPFPQFLLSHQQEEFPNLFSERTSQSRAHSARNQKLCWTGCYLVQLRSESRPAGTHMPQNPINHRIRQLTVNHFPLYCVIIAAFNFLTYKRASYNNKADSEQKIKILVSSFPTSCLVPLHLVSTWRNKMYAYRACMGTRYRQGVTLVDHTIMWP